jgi:hypothetical protein
MVNQDPAFHYEVMMDEELLRVEDYVLTTLT